MHPKLSAIFTLLAGTLGAQLLTFAVMPWLTRLYSPEHFGYLGIFMSVANVVLPIAALTLPMAIVIAKDKRQAVLISQMGLLCAALVSVLCAVLFIVKQAQFNMMLGLPNSSFIFILLPVFIVFSALNQVADNWAIRLSAFRLKARVIFLTAILANFVKVIAGVLLPSALILVGVTVLMPLFSAFLIYLTLRGQTSLIFKAPVKLNRVKGVLQTYHQFPQYQAPQVALNALSQGIPVLVLGAFFGAASAGLFTFAKLILMTPVTLVAKSVGDVLYGELATTLKQKAFVHGFAVLSKATLVLALLGFIPLLVLLFWAEPVFAFVFGEPWRAAGEYAKWLAFWTFAILINPPSVKAMIALNKQKFSLVINLVTLALRALVLYVGAVVINDVLATVQYYVLVSVLHNVVIIVAAHVFLRRACRQTLIVTT